jgi:hypothetical protein
MCNLIIHIFNIQWTELSQYAINRLNQSARFIQILTFIFLFNRLIIIRLLLCIKTIIIIIIINRSNTSPYLALTSVYITILRTTTYNLS